MNAEVIVAFADRENPGTVYKPGDTFTGTAERVKSLKDRGFVKAASKAKATEKKE